MLVKVCKVCVFFAVEDIPCDVQVYRDSNHLDYV